MTEAEMLYQELMTPPTLFPTRRVLCIQPHPDDNEVGAGAIIAKLADLGAEIAYLTITNGDLGSPLHTTEETSEIRSHELQEAGRCLGASAFYSLGLPDNFAETPEQVALEIIRIIRRFRPDVILCPDPWLNYEAHPDHRKTGLAAAQAFLLSGNTHLPKGETNTPFAAEKIAFYFTSHPNTVVDVTGYLEQQFIALQKHKSQFDDTFLETLRLYFIEKGQKLAEGLGFSVGMGLKVLGSAQMHCMTGGSSIACGRHQAADALNRYASFSQAIVLPSGAELSSVEQKHKQEDERRYKFYEIFIRWAAASMVLLGQGRTPAMTIVILMFWIPAQNWSYLTAGVERRWIKFLQICVIGV